MMGIKQRAFKRVLTSVIKIKSVEEDGREGCDRTEGLPIRGGSSDAAKKGKER
jgi:hypothetical protein